MCQNIKQKEDTWFHGLGDLMWNYPVALYGGQKKLNSIDFFGVSVKGCIVYNTINSNLVLKRTNYGLRSGQYPQLDN